MHVESFSMTKEIRAKAEGEASRILRDCWDDNELPVNPVRIAKRLGATVFEAQLPLDVSGIFKRDESGRDLIYLDVDDSYSKRRFTCAHEIGHLVRVPAGDTSVRIERRDARSRRGDDAEEIFANSFSAALLMPASVIDRFVRAGLKNSEIARHLRVSEEALWNRLDNLRRDRENH